MPGATLLFLISDTGGGHRRAAEAVSLALESEFPGRFSPVLCDPLAGPGSTLVARKVIGLYGPLTRRAPTAWGCLFHMTDSARVMALTHRYLLAGAASNVRHALERHRPAVVVSFHPLTGTAAVEGRRQAQSDVPIVTVVTDLATVHRAWRDTRVDRMAVATAAVRGQCRLDGLPPARCLDTGLPVRPGLHPAAVPHDRFVVLVVGGGEGSGGMGRQVEALVERFDDITVVAVCGRNQRLRRRLDRLASFRLIVTGFVDDLAQWMSAADVLVTKAGPGTIAEAACCGTPLILTSFLPGQEEGNIDHVIDAGAGRYAPTVADLLGQIDHLRRHPPELASMGAAALRMSRPHAAADIAHLVAGMAAVGRAPAASARA